MAVLSGLVPGAAAGFPRSVGCPDWIERFLPHLNSDFLLPTAQGDGLTLRLEEVVAHPTRGVSSTECLEAFSLLFSVPDTELFTGEARDLTHPALGSLSMSLLPVGMSISGRRHLEAVFTRFAFIPAPAPVSNVAQGANLQSSPTTHG